MRAMTLSFEIGIMSHEALHFEIVFEAIRETLLWLESRADQAQA
jgi:hypothetical protein